MEIKSKIIYILMLPLFSYNMMASNHTCGYNYTYDANGNKLKTIHKSATKTHTTEYCGSHIYEDGILTRSLFDGGYITYNGTSPQYHYHITDHQGNIRLVANTAGTAEQVTHYYPYGLPFAEGKNATLQPYKYNGKELDTEDGLNLYDYGARHYDAAICRWNAVDALAEKYASMGGYVYCAGNPIMFIDPDGKDGKVSINGTHITITSVIYVSNCSSAIAKAYEKNIMATWGKMTKYNYKNANYSIAWNVHVICEPLGPKQFNGINNYMEVTNDIERSSVKNRNYGKIRKIATDDWGANSSTNHISHEFGHMLGMNDKYTDTDNGVSVPLKGWNGNIMAELPGKVEKKNLDILLSPLIDNNDVKSYKQNMGLFEQMLDYFNCLQIKRDYIINKDENYEPKK